VNITANSRRCSAVATDRVLDAGNTLVDLRLPLRKNAEMQEGSEKWKCDRTLYRNIPSNRSLMSQ
jgi:hypothetical protein